MKGLIRKIKDWSKAIGIALLLALLIKVVWFETFTIPSSSMLNTLQPGDVIMVNKLRYGGRLPMTLLTVPFTHQYLPFSRGTRSFLDWISLPYMRLPGTGVVASGDLVVFNYPMDDHFPVDHRTYYIKRCLGVPGSTIHIIDDICHIDGHDADTISTLCHNYILKSKDKSADEKIRAAGIQEGGRYENLTTWMITADQQQIRNLREADWVTSVEQATQPESKTEEHLFPYGQHHWNSSHYGPLHIPAQGDTLQLDKQNVPFYERIISEYEEHELSVSPQGRIFIDDVETNHYVVEMNYYFMLGDNRHNSADSRQWGFVPEDHVIGKVGRVIYSVDRTSDTESEIRWDRLFYNPI